MQIHIELPEHLHEHAELTQQLVQAMVNRLTLDVNTEPTKLGRPPTKGPRNLEIWELTRKGYTHAQISAIYGISLPRVAQIVAQMRATMTQGEAAV